MPAYSSPMNGISRIRYLSIYKTTGTTMRQLLWPMRPFKFMETA